MNRRLVVALGLLVLVTGVTAWTSNGYFHTDEHYQVLEFASLKLGRTAVSELPWEYGARLRPWMQPWLYYVLMRGLIWAGVSDPFDLAFGCRLVSGLFSCGALAAFAGSLFPQQGEAKRYVGTLALFGFLPYLFVRTSSENLSGACVAFACALVLGQGRARWVLCGVFLGVAFEARYQSVFLGAGLVLWLALRARARLLHLALLVGGGLLPVLAAVCIDRWGYGEWCFPPWNYVRENLFHGVADQFGKSPVYAYSYLVVANIFFPSAALLVVAMVLSWIRHPGHPVTWMTVPFVLVHSLIAHKEERFLFPMVLLATSFPLHAFGLGAKRCLVKVVSVPSLAGMVFLAIYPFGFGVHIPMERYLYRTYGEGFTGVVVGRFRPNPMYLPQRYEVTRLEDLEGLKEIVVGRGGSVNLLIETPDIAGELAGLEATRVYSEFPFAGQGSLARLSSRVMVAYNEFGDGMALPHLAWMTLYRVELR
ncbi:MAG: hypothetical protein WCI05_07315 [Myxococcales bacterium]